MSALAAETTLSSADFGALRIQLVADAGLALLVLLANTTLSVHKPWGMTRYGRNIAELPSHSDSRDDTGVGPGRATTTSTPWGLYVLLGIIGLVLLFVILHLTGGGLGGH